MSKKTLFNLPEGILSATVEHDESVLFGRLSGTAYNSEVYDVHGNRSRGYANSESEALLNAIAKLLDDEDD